MRTDAMELLANQEFVSEFTNVRSAEEAKQLFENKGVTLTDDELVEVLEKVTGTNNDVEGAELTEEQMGNVVGGSAIAFALGVAAGVIISEVRRKRR